MKQVLSFAIVMLTGLGIFIQSRHSENKAGDSTEGYQLGDQVVDFKLSGVDGASHSLSDYYRQGAEGVIVIFTCNTCPVSRRNEDRIIALHQKTSILGFPVVAINTNDPEKSSGDDFAAMQARASDKSYPFDYLQDMTQEVGKSFGAAHTPQAFLLDKEQRVRYMGAIDDSPYNAANASQHFIEDAVNHLKQGTMPDPAITKSIGCSIKYRT